MQRQIDNNLIQNCEKIKRVVAALINKHNEALPEANFSEMFPLSTPQVQPFSMAKRSLLEKNASATDLTQYINPVLVNRRRSSLFCTAVDPALKRMRQREAYKTAMCQAWLEGRTCVYGDQCNFAHGEDELQPLPANRSNPKHKTRICENYTTTGICPFGNRCFFIHPKTEEELETLLKLSENLPLLQQHQQKSLHHHFEGEALVIQPPLARSPQGDVVRRVGIKLKQFRKMDSCGTFNLSFQVQAEQKAQHPSQPLQQWPSSATAITGENYEQFPPLASPTVGMLAGKNLISMKSNVSSTKSSLIPLIHSTSVTNLNYTADQKIENAERELDKRLAEMRMTMRKMSQQKSFSSSDVCTNRAQTQNSVLEKQEEAEKKTSGPHTPPLALPALSAYSFPGFYEQERLGWSNASSLASVWSPPATTEQQAVPTFTFFEANSQIGGGTPSIERGHHQLLRAGKRSPDFEGILMGRRSSHIPLLEENNESLLNVLESGRMQKSRNKSAEYLASRCRVGGGDGKEESAKNNGRPSQDDHERDQHCDSVSSDCVKKEKIYDGDTVTEIARDTVAETAKWGEIGRQSCGSSKWLNNLQTDENIANGVGDNGTFKIGHNANNCKSNNIQPIRTKRCSDRVGGGISNLDKMQHLWTSSSPNLENKYREGSPPSHQLWTPFGIQKVEIPSMLDLSGNYNDPSLNMSEQRDRIDTLTNAKHRQEEEKEEEELVNLYSKFHLNDETNSAEKEKHSDDIVGGINEFINPTWAQMVRRKSYLRQKSHSSPAINRNCPAAAGNM